MKQFYTRLLRLLWGLFLYALGIVVTMNARIGYAPWDAFHVGISKMTGISIGTASIIVGVIIVVITMFLGEKIGTGTIFNMVLIGVFIDFLLGIHIIPVATNLLFGVMMVIFGLFIIGLASYYYIGSSFGAGPRDSLMIAVTRKTGFPVGVCRGIIELSVVLIGWRLGGKIGIGTVISAFAIGFCIETTFRLLKFDVTKIEHDTLDQTYKMLFKKKEPQIEQEAPENH